MRFPHGHLAYCTNIHPAESWPETRAVLERHTLRVRDLVGAPTRPFAIGLRLSARAAHELRQGSELAEFRDWLDETQTYVFTINGFPYGDFHGTRVKEQVYAPDWTSPDRLRYTQDLFRIIAELVPEKVEGSVSTLPGSFKAFAADESVIHRHLTELAGWIDDLADETGTDLHLGLEPEPLGHFENTRETLGFFERLFREGSDCLPRRLGVNYDCCHFAVEYEDATASLEAFRESGIRISKIHLSSAVTLDPRDPAALEAVRSFDEPTYLHQVVEHPAAGGLIRHPDLPDALASPDPGATEWRVHFHIPLDHDPAAPFGSTRRHAEQVLDFCDAHPETCSHFEIETYTWGVLPDAMKRPVEEQIAGEYRWVLDRCDA
jgi:hypothetical protein